MLDLSYPNLITQIVNICFMVTTLTSTAGKQCPYGCIVSANTVKLWESAIRVACWCFSQLGCWLRAGQARVTFSCWLCWIRDVCR